MRKFIDKLKEYSFYWFIVELKEELKKSLKR